MDDVLVERVLRLAEAVPPGRVVSYGDIAAALGTGPRQVGRVLALWGHGVPWWRVTNAAGELPPDLLPEARRRWSDEEIVVKGDGRGCRLVDCRWPAAELADAVRRIDARLSSDASPAES